MIVSTKGRYALRVMIDLAEHRSEKYVPLKEVAARQEISEKYLENMDAKRPERLDKKLLPTIEKQMPSSNLLYNRVYNFSIKKFRIFY